MPSLSQVKDMFRLQREAKKIKKELKNIHVEAEAQGVVVVVNAEQEVISITIPEGLSPEKLSPLLIDALNRALKKAQVVASEKMQGVMGELGLGGGGDSGMKGMAA